MHRIRWFDPESDDPATPVDWPVPALILATLFLNILFWEAHGLSLWPFRPLPLYLLLLGAVALLVTALFFMGPSLATQAARLPLLGVIENSFGSIPAFGLRLCCVLYLVLWIAYLIAVPVWLWSSQILRRQVSSTESGIFAAAVLVFLFVTGSQSLRSGAKLALFTNKLGIAILVAALIRVHEGWPAVLDGFRISGERSWISEVWRGLSELTFYVAPLALLAANFGQRSPRRKQVAMTGLMGIALPLFGTLLIVDFIGAATHASRFYQPSLSPSVAMALWGHAAGSGLPGRMMVAAITIFGAVRFGVRALAETASIRTPATRRGWVLLGCFVGAIAWAAVHPDTPTFTTAFDFSARCLAVTGAVLTVDFMVGRQRVERLRRIDWVGSIALLAGLATPMCVPHESMELLPSYLVGFLVCLCGRAVQKMPVARQFEKARH